MVTLDYAQTTVHIGIPSPIKLLHITDTHICRAYESEGEDKVRLALARSKNAFGEESEIERLLEEALAHAKSNGEKVVFTGDIYDFLSQANFDYLDEKLRDLDYIYAAGNHDFCTAPGADKEDYPFKKQQWKLVAPHIKDNLQFASHLIGGVNLITIDDSYYQFTEGQLDMLRAEADKGYPMVLFMHTPLYTPLHAAEKLKLEPCASLVDAPDDVLAVYPADRADYQKADEATHRVVEYIKSEPLIKALFAGHTHRNFEEPLDNGIMQYTTGGTFFGQVREIVIE